MEIQAKRFSDGFPGRGNGGWGRGVPVGAGGRGVPEQSQKEITPRWRKHWQVDNESKGFFYIFFEGLNPLIKGQLRIILFTI